MMLGTLQILRHMTDDIHGEVRIVFQPSEENGQGAKLMIGTGVLDGVDGAYAAHIWSEVDAGTVSCEPGPRMANTDWFRIDVRGTSCHGRHAPARSRRRYGGRRDRQRPADHRLARD